MAAIAAASREFRQRPSSQARSLLVDLTDSPDLATHFGRMSSRSVPEVLEPLGVASLGLPATDADHVKTLRAGLE